MSVRPPAVREAGLVFQVRPSQHRRCTDEHYAQIQRERAVAAESGAALENRRRERATAATARLHANAPPPTPPPPPPPPPLAIAGIPDIYMARARF